ncbi:hypothetical protein [Mucilaginibacter psychrotolerans]|uniref:Uncharacterized protein n=1 Tax=Mucilaginibacter psychrotolerans TaxID=1524096 RepID=A0A4Y8S6Y9_9SPHI|nr:hypothetical protein [Mucilaginibacter psychrotolerans]TFF34391.1 hypothetical protein E2R66_22210 [Mucilaginibacter psychrotolerans]
MDFTTGISIFFNLLLIGAFIIDRVFRIKSINEYKEAKQAQIDTLKEKIDLLANFNDDFIAKKLKSQIDNLKSLIESSDNPEIKGKLEQF